MDCQLNQKQELQACMNNTPQTEGSFILRGQAGNGIIDIQKTSSEELVDTYTIYYTNGNTDTFTVTNGKDGAGDVQSVNGQIGNVVLTASDVGALPDSTVIPDAQIQSDWSQSDNTKVDYIKNKPTIPVDSDLVHKTGAETISGTKTFTGNPVFKGTAYNQCITVERQGTLGSFVAFKNSNGAIGALGTHANQIPMYANYNNTDTRALVRAGCYTTSAPDAHVGDATTPVYIDANGIAQPCSLNGNSRNVGEIVTSTIPLTDAGLHLLDGSLLQYGSYKAFIDYMADLYGDGTNIPDYFCSESDWQTSVTNYGVCGKFVYDSTNNTVRLPKITGILEGTTDVNALGDLVEAGLPNITGGFYNTNIAEKYSGVSGWNDITGAFSYTKDGGTYASSWGNGTGAVIHFNASDSNSIYGNSTTVQPQTIKAFYYIVIANSTKTEIEVDIDEVMTDLNGKANITLSNLTNGLSNTICTTKPTTISTASSSTPAVVVENYQAAVTGTRFVRVWSDGFCEQSGYTAGGASAIPVTLLKDYADTNFVIFTQGVAASGYWGGASTAIPTGKGSFVINCQDSQRPYYWRTEGYIDLS